VLNLVRSHDCRLMLDLFPLMRTGSSRSRQPLPRSAAAEAAKTSRPVCLFAPARPHESSRSLRRYLSGDSVHFGLCRNGESEQLPLLPLSSPIQDCRRACSTVEQILSPDFSLSRQWDVFGRPVYSVISKTSISFTRKQNEPVKTAFPCSPVSLVEVMPSQVELSVFVLQLPRTRMSPQY
jgi:hypothetical protein